MGKNTKWVDCKLSPGLRLIILCIQTEDYQYMFRLLPQATISTRKPSWNVRNDTLLSVKGWESQWQKRSLSCQHCTLWYVINFFLFCVIPRQQFFNLSCLKTYTQGFHTASIVTKTVFLRHLMCCKKSVTSAMIT